ncbi:hypothetical protein C7964_102334 [Loktanella sp. PT4BL]|jgi:hypothetical protein|uniref:DEAD/DEAH box helicase n=1 Tax=Loktanella sp. PT4BL TaxID=2135611 RepID=UPI000D76F603|nr:DEAD/DEAH box helicase [Loktanella sp. PT4BL]PXW70447.1 hypothetical protein C7964_102334 [Loktanella sp. PT4BL]
MHTSKVTEETKAKVATLLNKVVATDQNGTWFFRSDTGTGKTTGFIEAVENYGLDVAIAVPTTEDVDNVYKAFIDMGHPAVMKWYVGSGTVKEDAKFSKVVIGTHKWLLGDANPTGHTGKNRLLIIDEVPNDITAIDLKGSDVIRAREVAEAYNLKSVGSFLKLEDWVQDQLASDDVRPSYEKMEYRPSKSSTSLADVEKEILKKVDREEDKKAIRKVTTLLEAAKDGRAYKCKVRNTSTGGFQVLFACFKFCNQWFDKQVIFSATSHLDGFQFHKDKDRLLDVDGVLVDYSNLKFTHVPWPKLDKYIPKIVGNRAMRQLATDHIKSMFDLGSGTTLVVVPKLIKTDVAYSLNASQEDGQGAHEGMFQGRKVYVTNWGRDVGSNAYRECETVILWSNLYKPKHTTFSELLARNEERVNDHNLSEVEGGRFTGRPKGLQQGQLLAGIKQMGCRGTARNVDDNGICAPMHLIMSWDGLEEAQLKGIFPNLQYRTHTPTEDRLKPRVTSKQPVPQKVLHTLKEKYHDRVEVSLQEVCTWIPNAKKHTKKFAECNDMFKMHGWEFIPTVKGRYGEPAKFVGKGF